MANLRLLGPLLLAALAGCGGSSPRLPPAAEPAKSPPARERPAGRVVHVGHKPEGMVLDPKTGLLAVALKAPDRLALLDARSGRVVRRVPLPGAARHLGLAALGGPVLVPAESADELVEVGLVGGPARAVRTGQNPHDAAPARGRVWVGDELQDRVTLVHGRRVVKTLAAPVQPGGVAATADGSRVGVVGVRKRALQMYDGRSARPLGKIDVGIGPTHVVALQRRFFVVDTRGNGLLEADIRGRGLVVHRRTQLEGAPYGIAVDPRRRRFWVTLTAENRVAELTDRHELRSFPTVRQPNSVAVDPRTGRVFVASRSDGTVQILDPGGR
jgi:DNA-binding beta-propeller fold protein YncE